MARHGASMHYLRPDRIMRTGVLQPIVGYQPQYDVLAVTQEFASGPRSGMALAGLGGTGIVGAIKRGWYAAKARIASMRASKMMLTNATPAVQAIVQQTAPVVAAGPVSPQVFYTPAFAPQFYAMEDMQRFLAMRGVAPARAEMFTVRRWNTYYNAG